MLLPTGVPSCDLGLAAIAHLVTAAGRARGSRARLPGQVQPRSHTVVLLETLETQPRVPTQGSQPREYTGAESGETRDRAQQGNRSRSGWEGSQLGSPAREWRIEMDVAALAQLLREAEVHHGSFEAMAPPHDWWDWYAAYIDARERESNPEEASVAAGRYMAEVKHVVLSPA